MLIFRTIKSLTQCLRGYRASDLRDGFVPTMGSLHADLYCAIDSNGDTEEFWFSERRNLAAARRLLRKGLKRHGPLERIIIDGNPKNQHAILSCDTADRLRDRPRRDLIETAWVILNCAGGWLGNSSLSMTADISTAPKPDQ